MSLGSWFRDYVYIPLGGNRVKRLRWLFNIFVVWFLTGFWHGAEWNFVIWGLYFGILLTLEKFLWQKAVEKNKVLGHIYVLFFTAISFMIFSANNMTEAVSRVSGMFGEGSLPISSAEFIYQLKNYGFVLIIAMLGATPIPKKCVLWFSEKKKTGLLFDIAEIVVLSLLMIVSTAYLADGSFNPFLYFRF